MSRKLAFLFVFGIAALAASQTQNKAPQEASSLKLMAMESEWADALQKSDAAKLGDILNESYVDTDEHGARNDKKGLLALLKSGDLKLESLRLSGMHVHDYGDAAIVVGIGDQKG